jgi:hypothetical protein
VGQRPLKKKDILGGHGPEGLSRERRVATRNSSHQPGGRRIIVTDICFWTANHQLVLKGLMTEKPFFFASIDRENGRR